MTITIERPCFLTSFFPVIPIFYCFFFSFLLRTLVHSFTGHCWFFVFCSMRSTIFNDNNMLFLFFTWFLTSSPAPIGFPLSRTFPLVARAKAKSPFHIQGLSRESRCSSNSRQVTDKQKEINGLLFFSPIFFLRLAATVFLFSRSRFRSNWFIKLFNLKQESRAKKKKIRKTETSKEIFIF